MTQFIGTTYRITFYKQHQTRFSYVLATNQLDAERMAKVYCNPGETIFRVKPVTI